MNGPYQRLLVPIDGSATSQRGFEEALKLAQAFDAAMVLLHVVEFPPMTMDMTGSALFAQIGDDLRRTGQRVLERAHESARAAGVASQAHLDDSPARVCDLIVRKAREHECDLIVMGTHGRRGIDHALLGRNAERVLRQAPCPVLLVRPAPTT
jgi:nucleotide-binding universal stress UspA family protein